MSIALLPAGLALLGVLLAIGTLWLGERSLEGASALGWVGIVAGAVGLRGESLGLPAMHGLAPGLGMAASACLAGLVAPPEGKRSRHVAAICGAVCSIGWVIAAVLVSRRLEPSTWQLGTMLISVHSAAWAASLTAALTGAALSVERVGRRGWTSLDPDDALREALGWSGRAVAIAWLTWPLSHLVNWRLQAIVGLGSPTEWVGLGLCLTLSGIWIAGLPRKHSRWSILQTGVVPFAILGLVAGVLGLSWWMGSPLGLNIPWGG